MKTKKAAYPILDNVTPYDFPQPHDHQGLKKRLSKVLQPPPKGTQEIVSMDLQMARKTFGEIREAALSPETGDKNLHKRLFELYGEIERSLPNQSAAANDATDAPGAADELTDIQAEIVALAANLNAELIHEVLYKLALWRWLAPELDQPFCDLQISDAVAYSAFRNLADILGERNVLTDQDRATEYSRLQGRG